LVAPWASEINFDEDLAPAIIEREVRVIRGGDHQGGIHHRQHSTHSGRARSWQKADAVCVVAR
jgi:hypothetical protein